MKSTNANVTTNIVVKSNRTNMVKTLKTTGGKFFGTTHVGVDGKLHSINGIMYKKQDHELGYLKVYSTKAKEMRLVNPQTLIEVRFKGITQVASKPRVKKVAPVAAPVRMTVSK